MIENKRLNGIILILGMLFLGASLVFDEVSTYFQIAGIVIVMLGAYLYSLKREDDSSDENE